MENTTKKNSIQSQPTLISPPQNNISDDITETVEHEDLDSRWLRWKCLKCGYLYEGIKALKKCPKCGNEDPDLFADVD